MKTEKKVVIKIESDHSSDNVRTSRKTLKDIKNSTSDKENIVTKSHSTKDRVFSDLDRTDAKKKNVLMLHKGVQVGEAVVTAEDLTCEEPGSDYWKKLAETRGDALNRSIQENEKLKEDIDVLKEENRICKEMLDESRNLVEILQEMINDKEDNEETDE